MVRNGTVRGLSPLMRFDAAFNDLVAQAYTSGKVLIHSDGKPWRPVLHVEHVVRTFELYLEAPLEAIRNKPFQQAGGASRPSGV